MDNFEKRMIIGGIIFAIGMVCHYALDVDNYIQLAIFFAGYLVVGYDVLIKTAKNLSHGQIFDEHFLMTVATLGAFIIGEYPEGMAVMLFFQVGEWFETTAVRKTRGSIAELVDIQPEYANVLRDGEVEKVDPDEVEVGDTIVVMPGEKIPLDGRIITGSTSLDTKSLTGESMPRDVTVGDEVISGTVNISSKIEVEVTKDYEDSTVMKVLELIEDSATNKAPTERFITKFARYYTPAVVVAAIIVAVVPILLGYDAETWVYRALTFLVVSCPCALVISVPLGYFCGIGAASKEGVLIKGGNYLEALAHAETIVMDKTGTLTEGRFEVSDMHAIGCTEEELLEFAAVAETFSNHPVAMSIKEAYNGSIDASDVTESDNLPGRGVRVVYKGKEIHAGNIRLMQDLGYEYCDEPVSGTSVHIAIAGGYKGHITCSDVVKEDTAEVIARMKAAGIKKTVMLSGDAQIVADTVGKSLGIDEIQAELLPADKTEHLKRIMEENSGKTVFVGDGINDAPSLTMADVGIAMGAMGSDAAIEAADLVIMDDDLGKIPDAIALSHKVNRIVMENIVFALAIKFLLLGLATFGIANMWMAVFGDVGVSVIAILNAMRCMKMAKTRAKKPSDKASAAE